MRYAFKLKNDAMVVFDPDTALLSITTPLGEVQNSTIGRAESRLLNLLLMEPGQTKSREEIIDYTWNDRVVASGSLNQAVFSLRNILNDSRDHEILMTVPRRGYCFNRQYVVNAPADLPMPPDTAAQPVEPVMEVLEANPKEALPLPSEKARPSTRITKAQLIGYILTLGVCAFTGFRSGFDTPKIEVSSIKQNDLVIHAVANTVAEAQSLRDLSAKQVQQSPELKGQVWLNLAKSNYSVSCVRPDLSTANLQSHSEQKDLALMIRQCLEATL
ncbi:DNA-binding protein [Pseudomonas sp. 09C 129]|uniref:transcriptional regulator n=1 Tax=unclassified Pseudomonas TaxID=196821 RepID=UPI0002722B79|nr:MULTISPECIES: winged helix-turn-helix domain-containing protein [unclassified Pseudomonas]AUF99429.1 DNA-binding protein [Pseudomonas sp. 09C 129]PXX75013.1 cholera toxin transcriptional activator [Pseudomonas sp. LAMO17WK12:I9]WIE50621.1 winged helix-turn-helix domain-containing protein [Pseudomonas sp. GM17]SNY16886.1 cholera toxin transcriptional activator [Pseudomonas sp. LAMO17WK12:I10]